MNDDRRMRDRDEFKREVKEAHFYGREGTKALAPWLAAGAVVLLLCGGGAYLWKVGISGPKGTGDTIIRNNDTFNRTEAQKRYTELYNGIQANDKQIQVLADRVKASPNDAIATMNLDGVISSCLGFVADYNEMANDPLKKDWLPVDFPAQLGQDSSTDCRADNN